MTVEVFRCPDCGATLRARSGVLPSTCEFCHAVLTFPGQPPAAVPPDLDEVVAQLRKGNKISAIKAYREKTGVGLREAKDAVEEIEKRLR